MSAFRKEPHRGTNHGHSCRPSRTPALSVPLVPCGRSVRQLPRRPLPVFKMYNKTPCSLVSTASLQLRPRLPGVPVVLCVSARSHVTEWDVVNVSAAHRMRLFGPAYRLVGSAADAEDMAQEALLRRRGSDRTVIEVSGVRAQEARRPGTAALMLLTITLAGRTRISTGAHCPRCPRTVPGYGAAALPVRRPVTGPAGVWPG